MEITSTSHLGTKNLDFSVHQSMGKTSFKSLVIAVVVAVGATVVCMFVCSEHGVLQL